MKRYLALILVLPTIDTNLFAAEAGMPQLDPKYWASQAFWLVLIFALLYLAISKFFIIKLYFKTQIKLLMQLLIRIIQ